MFISVDRVCSVMSVGKMLNVRVVVPDGGYNKLICKSTRLWWHVVARKSAASAGGVYNGQST